MRSIEPRPRIPVETFRAPPRSYPQEVTGMHRRSAACVTLVLVLVLLAGSAGVGFAAGGRAKSWMILFGDDATVINGSVDDVERIQELRERPDQDLVWFRQSGREYLVRDPALVREAQAALAPQMELSARQAELGAQQGKLGARQGELGAQQGELGARQGRLAARRARDGSTDAGSESFERRQAEIEREMERLGEQMEALGRQMDELGREMEALGRQIEQAGDEAERQLQALFARALEQRLAQPLR
jgi:hypothetical protein